MQRIFSGAYLAGDSEVTLALLVEAALRVAPSDAVVTGVTALRCYGLAVGPLRPLHLVTTHVHPVRRPGLQVTRTAVLPAARHRVVHAERAFVGAAPALDLVELVSAGDHLVRTRQVTSELLVATASTARGRGALLARRAAGLVRARVDSPRETELRLCLVLAGLPEPECNPLVGDEFEAVGRVDMRYREFGVLLEYEGDQHRRDRWQWNRDIERHEGFAAEGRTLVRMTAARMNRPRAVVGRVLQALRAGGYKGPDPKFTAEWVALFSPSVRESRRRRAFEPLSRTLDDPR